jgi:hypothetical protein
LISAFVIQFIPPAEGDVRNLLRQRMETQCMGDSRAIWSESAWRRAKNDREALVDYVLIALLLIIMAAAEVQFLLYVAGPDSVSLIQAADGIVPPDQINSGSNVNQAGY